MREPGTPKNETERLVALACYDVLDTRPEPTFDRLALLAQALFEVPIALITLVDQKRQWFKARIGLEVEETPRAVSFCGHVVAQERILVVPDALEHPDFFDNPLVLGPPYIRFYAGAPLVTPEGHYLGTLCVLDTRPRQPLDARQLELLQSLADLVVDELDLRILLRELSHHAFHDPLTRLPNRALFIDRLQQAILRADREKHQVAVWFMDLDQFKAVNDSAGHAAGDRYLQAVARTLCTNVRPVDTVARYGGDEFVGVISLSGEQHLLPMMTRLSMALAGEEATQPFSASVGAAIYPDHARTMEALLDIADQAMYRAKDNGGGFCLAEDDRLHPMFR